VEHRLAVSDTQSDDSTIAADLDNGVLIRSLRWFSSSVAALPEQGRHGDG
jgi:hypothetical protein